MFFCYARKRYGNYVLFIIGILIVEMNDKSDSTKNTTKDTIKWTKYAEVYDPIRIGSIDGWYKIISPN